MPEEGLVNEKTSARLENATIGRGMGNVLYPAAAYEMRVRKGGERSEVFMDV